LVPEELRKHIVLGKNGTIDVSALQAAESDNAALQGLLRLASSRAMYDIVSTDTVSLQKNEVLKEELLGHALLFDLNLKYQHELLPSQGRAVNTFIFRILLGQPYQR
jgi:hypothetical protein